MTAYYSTRGISNWLFYVDIALAPFPQAPPGGGPVHTSNSNRIRTCSIYTLVADRSDIMVNHLILGIRTRTRTAVVV